MLIVRLGNVSVSLFFTGGFGGRLKERVSLLLVYRSVHRSVHLSGYPLAIRWLSVSSYGGDLDRQALGAQLNSRKSGHLER